MQVNTKSSPCLCVMLTAFNILRPIANILVEVKHKHCWTWHVMFSFAFAHVVMCAVELVGMITDMAVLFRARHLVRYGKLVESTAKPFTILRTNLRSLVVYLPRGLYDS